MYYCLKNKANIFIIDKTNFYIAFQRKWVASPLNLRHKQNFILHIRLFNLTENTSIHHKYILYIC